MRVRSAKLQDKKGILRLYEQFNQDRIESGVGDARYQYIKGEMPWSKTLIDEECLTLVAVEKKIVLGFITLRLPEFNPFTKVGKLAEVDLTVVERKLRRRGIGTMLFNAAKRQLKVVGVTHALLNVKYSNLPARIFWKKIGFKKVSDTKFKRIDGVEEKTVYMVKKI